MKPSWCAKALSLLLPIRLLPVIFLVFFCLLQSSSFAQSWNRAVFRNDEIDPRDFTFNDEYFLNLQSYQYWPDWEEKWDASDSGYRITVGSVRSDEFFLHQEAKLHLDITEHFRFHYDLLQHEDFDTRYLRQRPTLVFPFHEKLTAYAFGEGSQLKQDNDIGVGAVFHPAARHWWEVQYTATDFNEQKGKMGRHFNGSTHAFMLKNRVPLTEDLLVGGSLEMQEPLTLIDPADDLRFRFRKSLYSAFIEWRTHEENFLALHLSGEDSGKQNRYSDPATVDRNLNRNAFRSTLEYRFPLEAPIEADWRAGFDYFYFREHVFLPEGGGESERLRRYEYTVFAGLSCPISAKCHFRPMLFIDYVSHNRLFPENVGRNDRYNGIQSKLSGAFEFRLTKTARLIINPNLDLDEMNWGGGNVQFIALF